jgi:hypothetical protein
MEEFKGIPYSKFLESDVVIYYKQRKATNVRSMELISEVR